MRRISLLSLSLLALSGCYGPGLGGGGYHSSRTDRWSDSGAPLVARVEETGIGLGIRLSEPAFVAVFEILPGEGVGLYYPAIGGQRSFFRSGFTTISSHGSRHFDNYFTGLPVRYRGDQPHFYFLIASREPLRSITRFQRSNGALRSVLGLTAYNTMNYRRVMDDLVMAVVPNQPDQDWTTDILAVWPSSLGRYAYNDNPRYVRVRCGSYTRIVPLELASWGCLPNGDRGTVAVVPPTSNHPHQPDDSTTVQAPGRHRPEPTDADGGGSAAQGGEVRTPRRVEPQRRPEPRDPDQPTVEKPATETPRARPEGGGGSDARERPQVERPAPREPREVAPRPEPRAETPRSEPTRAEPVRSEPARSEPSPAPAREAPVHSRPEKPPVG